MTFYQKMVFVNVFCLANHSYIFGILLYYAYFKYKKLRMTKVEVVFVDREDQSMAESFVAANHRESERNSSASDFSTLNFKLKREDNDRFRFKT